MKSLLKAETPITTCLSACKILLESEYSTTVVEKVKRELATTKKDGWSNALNGNTELLDIVRRSRESAWEPYFTLGSNIFVVSK